MRIQGTIIEEGEETFGVFLVSAEVLADPAKRQARLDELAEFFEELPLVLLAPDESGRPVHHGRPDLVAAISDRPFFGFVWREYVLE